MSEKVNGARGVVCSKCGADDWHYQKSNRGWHCRPCRSLVVKLWKHKLRADTIEHYGGKCACCGESEPSFLTIDHINGNGNAHRKEIGRGSVLMYKWLKKNGWPEGYQVLCWNCNCARHLYQNAGVCPHEKYK